MHRESARITGFEPAEPRRRKTRAQTSTQISAVQTRHVKPPEHEPTTGYRRFLNTNRTRTTVLPHPTVCDRYRRAAIYCTLQRRDEKRADLRHGFPFFRMLGPYAIARGYNTPPTVRAGRRSGLWEREAAAGRVRWACRWGWSFLRPPVPWRHTVEGADSTTRPSWREPYCRNSYWAWLTG